MAKGPLTKSNLIQTIADKTDGKLTRKDVKGILEAVATIAYADLLFAANELSQKSFRPLETYTVVALIYFVVIFLASQLARLLELRLARSGESTVH